MFRTPCDSLEVEANDVKPGDKLEGLRMNSINHAASHRLTPRKALAKPSRDENSLRFSLSGVIGTTTVSANAVDCLPDLNVVATCAGSAAILSRFDVHLNVTQRIFRAGPNATAVNVSSTFYNSNTPPALKDLAAR